MTAVWCPLSPKKRPTGFPAERFCVTYSIPLFEDRHHFCCIFCRILKNSGTCHNHIRTGLQHQLDISCTPPLCWKTFSKYIPIIDQKTFSVNINILRIMSIFCIKRRQELSRLHSSSGHVLCCIFLLVLFSCILMPYGIVRRMPGCKLQQVLLQESRN